MKLPASQALYAYWTSLCQGRSAPERSDLDPAAMRHMLAHTFLLDVGMGPSGTRTLSIRLSGSRIDALFGRDLKGSDLIDLSGVSDRALLGSIVDGVLDDVQPAVVGGCTGPAGAPRLGFELTLLPLRHLGKTQARMLGGLALAGTPSWLGLQAAEALDVTSWRMLDGAAVAGQERQADRRAHLVVYEGGRASDANEAPARQARVKPVLSRWVNRR